MTIKARPLRIEDDQLVVTIPVRSLAALKSDPAVLYLERVGGTADDESPLIGEPVDPQPGAQSKHLTPHALGAISWDSGTYAYDGAGNIVSIGTDKYLYDGVQRLKQSSTQGSIETYTYDGFGNMKTKTNSTIPSVDSATNRYMGYSYNQIGAVTSDGSYTFTYDALGQPLRKVYNNQSNTVEDYVYTPGDERIGVQRGGWWTWSVRDESGKVLRQYKSSATNLTDPALWLEDFVWRDGVLLGSQRPVEMGGRRHFHLDHLGTARLITSDSGQMVSYHDYYPFGDEYSPVMQESSSGFGREEPLKFTGHERDYAGGMGAEDGHALDYMHARYYSPFAGRFVSPDPVLGDMDAPQSWNRYVYALNSPLFYVDPFGLEPMQSDEKKDDCPAQTDKCSITVKPTPSPKPKPKRPEPKPTTWYEDSVREFALFKAQSLSRSLSNTWYARFRQPDYYAFTVNFGSVVGGTVQIINDRYGRVYIAGGGNIGKSATALSGSLVAGWLNQASQPTADRLYAYIHGASIGAGAGYGLGGNKVWGMPGVGKEAGVFSPQIGATGTYAFQPDLDGYRW
jgi:RHS repeat-associated protein